MMGNRVLAHARHRRTFARVLFAYAILLWPWQAHAALLDSCRPEDSDLVCRLRGVLSLLDVVAVVLGVLLVLAVAIAVRAYRRKPRKVESRDAHADVW